MDIFKARTTTGTRSSVGQIEDKEIDVEQVPPGSWNIGSTCLELSINWVKAQKEWIPQASSIPVQKNGSFKPIVFSTRWLLRVLFIGLVLASIKRWISRVEGTPALAHANLFADISCDNLNPLKNGHISICRTDCPGLSRNEPMAIVQMPIRNPSIPDGKYHIKNWAADIYWAAPRNPVGRSIFGPVESRVQWRLAVQRSKRRITTGCRWTSILRLFKCSKNNPLLQWHITNDTNGNIYMTSPIAPSSWVGAEMTGSTVPVRWRLIPAEGKSY